jgi:ribose-phosphate pyrophosphokinase
MKINKYPDNSSYVKEEDFINEIVFKINSYQDLWYLNQYVDVCNHNGYRPTIIIPNLIDAQADRRFNKNESSGLKLVCNFLNNMQANFKIFHPHNPEVVEALIDNVEIIDNSNFINEVLFYIAPGPGFYDSEKLGNLILMSSDAGGFKPLMKLCDKINWQGQTSSASKSRTYNNNKSTLFQQIDRNDFLGKDILIIDDICVYGGTFKGLSKMLIERNCGKLYLAVSHMTVQNLGDDPVTNYFDKVFTTNSKFDEYDWGTLKGNGNPKNLEIIKIF